MEPLTLDELDRQLVHALQLDGRVSFGRMAEVLGVSDRTLSRRYRRLRGAGVLRVVGVPDARALGRADWLVRMRVAPHAAAGIAAVLAARDDTSWVALASGGAEITCLVRVAAGDALVLASLPRSPRIGTVTAQRLLRPVAGVGGWPARVAALTGTRADELRFPTAAEPVTLTREDRRLLAPLARDGRMDWTTLASATGLSAAAVARRVTELRRVGALSLTVDVEPGLFGAPRESALWVTVRPDALVATGRALARRAEVTFAAVTTGATNLVVLVACADDDALHDDVLLPIGRTDGVTHIDLAPIERRVSRSVPVPA